MMVRNVTQDRHICPFFFKESTYSKTVHIHTYPITEQQTYRFTIMRTTYTFRDGRTDI